MKTFVIVACLLTFFLMFWERKTAGTDNSILTCPVHDYMLRDFDKGTQAIVAPNGKNKIVLAKDFSLNVFVGGREVGTVDTTGMSADLEILWAPDSQKFGVT